MKALEQDCHHLKEQNPKGSDGRKALEQDNEQTLEQLESNIAMLSAQIQAATYRLLCLVGTYEQLEGWVSGGFVSCAHWLAWRTGDDLITAREKVRVARALRQLPLISAAFARAELSYSKVRAVTRIATPDNEPQLLTMALEGTASQLERIVRGFRQATSLELAEAQAQHEARTLQYHYTDQGMLKLNGLLPAEVGALVVKAIEAAADALKEQTDVNEEKQTVVEEVSTSQRQADALALLAESAMDHRLARGSRADRYQVVVHVDADALEDRSRVATTKNSAEALSTPDADADADSLNKVTTTTNSAEALSTPDANADVDSLNKVATTKNSAETWMRAELENGVGLCAETCRRLACEGCTVILREDQQIEDRQRACPDPDPSSIVTSETNIGRKKRRLSAAP